MRDILSGAIIGLIIGGFIGLSLNQKDIKMLIENQCYKQTIDDNSMTILHRIKCPE